MRKLPSEENCIFDSQLFSTQVYWFLIKNSQLFKLIKTLHLKNTWRRWEAITLLLVYIFNFLQKFKIQAEKKQKLKALKSSNFFCKTNPTTKIHDFCEILY